MSTLDGNDLFGSGPHAVRPVAWERAVARRGFPGVDGELVLDMGLRSRAIEQTGRLQAGTAADLHAALAAIETYADGRLHRLIDPTGRTYANVLVERFEPATPVRHGRGFFCEYTLHYRQLP